MNHYEVVAKARKFNELKDFQTWVNEAVEKGELPQSEANDVSYTWELAWGVFYEVFALTSDGEKVKLGQKETVEEVKMWVHNLKHWANEEGFGKIKLKAERVERWARFNEPSITLLDSGIYFYEDGEESNESELEPINAMNWWKSDSLPCW
jgi:hypothetical protein